MAELIRWSPRELFRPFEDIGDLREEMNRMLGTFFGRTPWGVTGTLEEGVGWYPAVDFEELDDKYLVKAELPGMKQSDIKVTLANGILTLSGERKAEHKAKKDDYYRYESCHGKFQRSFTLPTEVKEDKIKAEYKDGILEIEIPKSEEVKPKEIEIQVH